MSFEVSYFAISADVTSFCFNPVACKERQSFSRPVDVVDEDRDASFSFCDDRCYDMGRLSSLDSLVEND
jgi:hypothetical protein